MMIMIMIIIINIIILAHSVANALRATPEGLEPPPESQSMQEYNIT